MTYPLASREAAFQAWYAMGRPSSDGFVKQYRDAQTGGKKLAKRTMEDWRHKGNWDARADELDAEATKAAEEKLVADRAKMLETHRNLGKMLQRAGQEYFMDSDTGRLKEGAITSDANAIYAVRSGVGLERDAVGLHEVVAVIGGMDDAQLKAYILSQLSERGEFEDEAALTPVQ